MKLLLCREFGNPVLRQQTRKISAAEILAPKTQELIADMRWTLERKSYGVGLAAPQVGHSVAISVIGIKPTPSRPDNVPFDLTIINPEIVETYGAKEPMWEGCVSFGGTKTFPYALVPRYTKIRVRYDDEQAKQRESDFEGIVAHVLQHEIDHLNGVLFVDRVEDSTSYMTITEYKKQFVNR